MDYFVNVTICRIIKTSFMYSFPRSGLSTRKKSIYGIASICIRWTTKNICMIKVGIPSETGGSRGHL